MKQDDIYTRVNCSGEVDRCIEVLVQEASLIVSATFGTSPGDIVSARHG